VIPSAYAFRSSNSPKSRHVHRQNYLRIIIPEPDLVVATAAEDSSVVVTFPALPRVVVLIQNVIWTISLYAFEEAFGNDVGFDERLCIQAVSTRTDGHASIIKDFA